MRMNRWLWLGAGVLAAALVAVVVLALWPPTPGVTKANFDRIEAGMTRDEVRRLIGCARTQDDWIPFDNIDVWMDEETGWRIRVGYDAERRVQSASWRPREIEERTIWHKIQQRLCPRTPLPEVEYPMFIY
jgi:hypothetical protein